MPDLLIDGRADPGSARARTWRRTRTTDALAVLIVTLLCSGAAITASERSVPAQRSAAAPGSARVYGSRPNLDLPTGANLRIATRGRASRYDRTPSADGLQAALVSVVSQLCAGAAFGQVLQGAVSVDHARASYLVTASYLGVPMKERSETGALAVRLAFRWGGYEFAADRRSGVCAG